MLRAQLCFITLKFMKVTHFMVLSNFVFPEAFQAHEEGRVTSTLLPSFQQWSKRRHFLLRGTAKVHYKGMFPLVLNRERKEDRCVCILSPCLPTLLL